MIFLFFLSFRIFPGVVALFLPELSRIRVLRSMPAHSETQREDIRKKIRKLNFSWRERSNLHRPENPRGRRSSENASTGRTGEPY